MMSDEQRQDTELHMGFDALWGAVVHGTEIDLAPLEGPKAAFDHPKALVGQGSILDTQGVVVSEQDPFAIEALGLSNRVRVQTHLARVGDL
jgi:hypothetical protein